MQNFLIVILGPTGIGKTDTSVNIAEKFNCEIISCDSRQFYREMSIGTAVPSNDQLMKVKHHFIRFLDAGSYYSSNMFSADVLKLLPELFEKNRLVIMTGGSGLYIDSVVEGTDDIPDTDPEIREKYTTLFRNEGIEPLRSALKLLDPIWYGKVDLRNPKRLIRALEVCESTGLPYSNFLKREKRTRNFATLKIGLNMPREELYRRIDSRVDNMITNGLEAEARSLYHLKYHNSLNTVGYKEMFGFFEGLYDLPEAIRLIKRNSRRYAKRQLTWWTRDNTIRWFHPSDQEGICSFISESTGREE